MPPETCLIVHFGGEMGKCDVMCCEMNNLQIPFCGMSLHSWSKTKQSSQWLIVL